MTSQINPNLLPLESGPNIGKLSADDLRAQLTIARNESTAHEVGIAGLATAIETLINDQEAIDGMVADLNSALAGKMPLSAADGFATAAQGAKADTAKQAKWAPYLGAITRRSNLPKGGGQPHMLTFSPFETLQPFKVAYLLYAFVSSAGETMKKIGATGVNGYADIYASILANGKNYPAYDFDTPANRIKRIAYGDYGLLKVDCGADVIYPGVVDVANYVFQSPHTDTGGVATAANQRMAHLNYDPADLLYYNAALTGGQIDAWKAAVDAVARPAADPAGATFKGEIAVRPVAIIALTTDDTWIVTGTSREHGGDGGTEFLNGYGVGEVQTVVGASGAGVINLGIYTEKITDTVARAGDGFNARGRIARTFGKRLAISYGINDRQNSALPSGLGNEVTFPTDMTTMVGQLYQLIDPTQTMKTSLATQAPITTPSWTGTTFNQSSNTPIMEPWNRLIRRKGLAKVCNQTGYFEMVPKTNGSNGFGQFRTHPNLRRIITGNFTLSTVAATATTPAYTNIQADVAGTFTPKDSGPFSMNGLGNPAYSSTYSGISQYIDGQNMRLFRASNQSVGDNDYQGSPLGAFLGSTDGGATTLAFPFTFAAATYPITINGSYETGDFLHRTKNGLKLTLQDNIELGLVPY